MINYLLCYVYVVCSLKLYFCNYGGLLVDSQQDLKKLTFVLAYCLLFVKVMHEEWKKYLLNKVQLRDIVNKKKKPKDPKPKGFGILDGVTPIKPVQSAETTSISKQEHDALLAAASKLRNIAENDHVGEDTPQPDSGGQGRAKRKRKVGIRNDPVILDGSGVQNNNKAQSTSDKIGMSDSKNKIDEDETNPISAGRFCETMQGETSVENIVLRRHTNPDAAARNGKSLPPVYFYALESDQPILDILKPSIVIVYGFFEP